MSEEFTLPGRDREKDQLVVCDMFIENSTYGNHFLWGLDDKRPFGFSGGGGAYEVMEKLGLEDDDREYAEDLIGCAGEKIKKYWKDWGNAHV